MSRGKITSGRAKYYTQTVASGIEDYMSGRGEAPGRWTGRGAAAIDLAGEVEVEQMARLFEGNDPLHPQTGELLGAPYKVPDGKDKVLGWDLTLSAPKSFSAMWAVAPREVRAVLDDCHRAAVEAALDHLEDHAAFSRAGRGGVAQLDTDGLMVARFDHRTSRSKDPQRHSHLVVSNRVHCSDGVWRSLDSRAMHRELKPAGTIYHAALRAETTTRLGLRWNEVDEHGQADIFGVPDGLLEFWSQRRMQIEARGTERIAEREAALGRSLTDAEIRQEYEHATLETRERKTLAAESAGDLHRAWQLQAAVHGWAMDHWLPQTLGHGVATPSLAQARLTDAALAELQRTKSTWKRADAVAQCARLLPPGAARSAAEAQRIIERLADTVLAAAEVVHIEMPTPEPTPGLQRRDGRSVFEPHGAATYTTVTTLTRESIVLDFAHDGVHAGLALAPGQIVEAVLPAHGLDREQQSAVRHLLSGGEQLVCLVGPAGTGKTRTLGAAVEAWTEAGVPTRGLAVSAVAADVLAQETGVPTETLAKFLHSNHGGSRLRVGEVVIVDEAGMASTVDLAALCARAGRAGAKVLLVGDPRQLGAIEAGGLFRLLAQDHGVALTGVHRFKDAWERSASLRLRDADAGVLETYEAQGRLHGGSREQHTETAFRTWLGARASGASVLLAAPDHATVDRLAMRIRATRVQSGEVEPRGLRLRNQVVGVGDEIVTLRNERRLLTTTGRWIRNGDRWEVTGRSRDGSLHVSSLQARGHARLPADYVAEEVALAYAVTIHKAQGVTVDHAVAVLDERCTDVALYVALTRGRHSNHALVVTADTEHDAHGPLRADRTARGVLADVLSRDTSERSATEAIRRILEVFDDRTRLREMLDDFAERAGSDGRSAPTPSAPGNNSSAEPLMTPGDRYFQPAGGEPDVDRSSATALAERLRWFSRESGRSRSRGHEIDDGMGLEL